MSVEMVTPILAAFLGLTFSRQSIDPRRRYSGVPAGQYWQDRIDAAGCYVGTRLVAGAHLALCVSTVLANTI